MENNERDDDLENPLGIARKPVPHDEHIHASDDEASRRRRRRRALGGVEERRTIVGESDDPEGATGIDMGSGGDGTGIKPPSR
jgi:hypothetical protein